MSNMLSTPDERMGAAAIADQARQLSEHYPDLYEHLTQRDRAIERALEQTMKNLAPGIGALCELVVPEPATHACLTEEAFIEG